CSAIHASGGAPVRRLSSTALMLRTPARSSAVVAFVAGPVPSHEAAAFRAERSIGNRLERKRLLRRRFGRPKARAVVSFRRIRSTKEPLAHPAEQIVNNRLRIRQLRIAGPAARLEAYVTELI